MALIEIKNVSKTYPHATERAVEDVSLAIGAGEKIGLIGANGSGKTTLMRLLMNFVLPDAGGIEINNNADLEAAKNLIGFVPERQEGMENFTPWELLNLSAQMHGIDPKSAKTKIEELLAFAELSDVADNLVSDFSKGMAQRVHICIALVHDPKILLLDEPMSGLDPGGQKDVREILQKLNDITMIYASHHLDEIETFCTRVVIIHDGHLVRTLSLDEIRQDIFTLELEESARAAIAEFEDLSPQILRERDGKIEVQFISNPEELQKVIAVLNSKNVDIKRMRSRSVLEDLYHRYIAETQNYDQNQHRKKRS